MTANGATWLDRELVAEKPEPLREAGFGGEVSDALALRRRELPRVAGQLSGELGLPYVEAKSGQKVTGTYRRHVGLASGRFAAIERSREFMLVSGGRCWSGIWQAGRGNRPGREGLVDSWEAAGAGNLLGYTLWQERDV